MQRFFAVVFVCSVIVAVNAAAAFMMGHPAAEWAHVGYTALIFAFVSGVGLINTSDI